MNRRKKIAMLAGLLGSISLSVVQAEISEKPVANKKYNDYLVYEQEWQIFPTEEEHYYFNKGAEIGKNAGGTGNAVWIDANANVTFHVGKAEGKDNDLSLIGESAAIKISSDTAFHIEGVNTNILLGPQQWDSYNDAATIYVDEGANFTVDAGSMKATGGAETNLKLFDNATATINLTGDFVSDAGGTGIANQNFHADSNTKLTINANNISLSTTDKESAERKAGLYLLAYGDGGNSTMEVNLHAQNNLNISGFKRGVQTFGSSDVDLQGKNVTVSAVNDTTGAGMYLRGYNATKFTNVQLRAENATIEGSQYGIYADDRTQIHTDSQYLTLRATNGWSVALLSDSEANFTAEQAKFYDDIYVEDSVMNNFANENIVAGQVQVLEGGVVTFDGKAEDGTGSASVVTTGKDVVTASSDTYDETTNEAVLSAVTFKQAAYINSQGVDDQGQADETYHADKQGVRTDSAIRAMRNSVITLDKATGIYGDIIAGKGAVDEEDGIDLDTMNWRGGHVDITSADGATVKGDVLAGNTGTIDFTLNNASYEGRVDDYADATLKHDVFRPGEFDVDVTEGGTVNMTLNDSTWTAHGQNFVTSLTFGESGGLVDLSQDENNSVTIRELSGDGTFHMLLNSENHALSDMLYIGKNTGIQTINIVGGITGGLEAISEDNPLRFATVGVDGSELPDVRNSGIRAYTRDAGALDLEYFVAKEEFDKADAENEAYNGTGKDETVDKPGNEFVENELVGDRDTAVNWIITGVREAKQSDAGKTVIAMSRANYSNAIYMDRLNKRMGEARYIDGDEGLWVRMRHDRIGKSDAFRSKNTMFELGYDRRVGDREDGEHRQGFVLDYMRGTAEYQNVAGDGDVRRGGIWLYDTWLGDKGHYTDYVFKIGRLSNDFEIYARSTGEKITGDYSNFVYSASAEYGRKKNLGNDWYIEPQAQIQYAHVTDADYTTSQDTQVDLDAIDSLIGRVGFRLGRDIGENNNFYIKADILHEFLGDQDISAKDNTGLLHTTYENEGTWYDVGLGFSHEFSKGTYMFFDVEKSFGNDNEDTYQFNVGMNWKV